MSREEVVKAIVTIREWCESRYLLAHPCDECPMFRNCAHNAGEWVVDE